MLVLARAPKTTPNRVPQPSPGPPARVPPRQQPGNSTPARRLCGLPQLLKLPCAKLCGGGQRDARSVARRPPKRRFNTPGEGIELDADAGAARRLQVAGTLITARVAKAAGKLARDVVTLITGWAP